MATEVLDEPSLPAAHAASACTEIMFHWMGITENRNAPVGSVGLLIRLARGWVVFTVFGQLELEHRLDFRGLGESVAHQALRLRVIEPAHRGEAQLVVLKTHLAAQALDPCLERGGHPGLERDEVAGGLSFGAGGGELGLLNDGRGIGGVVASGESCKDDRERHGPERIRRHTSSLEEGGQRTRDTGERGRGLRRGER